MQLARAFIAREGRWPRIVIAATCALVFALFATNSDMGGDPSSPRGDGKYRPVLARGDGHMLYIMSMSTVFDRDWVFDNQLGKFGDPWNQPRTKTGRKGIPHPIGPALVWAPLLATAHVGAKIANVFGAGIPEHGYDPWHQRIVFLSSVVFACAAVLLARRLAARAIGGSWAPTYGAALVLLGTSLTYYATYMPSYGHAMDAFWCALFLGYWAKTLGRRDLRRFITLGVMLGVATLVRIQEIAFGIVLVVELAYGLVPTPETTAKQRLRSALDFAWRSAVTLVVALVVFTPQVVEWHVVHGSITELPQGAKYTRLGSPLVLEMLFSSRNGWFTTTPLAYAAVLGLFCLPRSARLVALGFGAVVLVQIYLNSTIFDWWGSASYGNRRLCNLTLPLAVGLSALIWRCGQLVARVPRIPRVAWHVLLVLTLGTCAARNVARITPHRAGKAAPATASTDCCKYLPPGVKGAAQWVYKKVGNPFAFPANVIFALEHDVPLARWEVAVGDYPMTPGLDTLSNGRLHRERGKWTFTDPYVISGLGPQQRADVPMRWTTRAEARVLVPNLMPYGQRYTLQLAPGGATDVELAWDGKTVIKATLHPGWNGISFDVVDDWAGTHELAIRSAIAPHPAPNAPFPVPKDPQVGVAVGVLEMQFLPGVD
ncbi:MAG: hypothetical protein SFX73_18435 [Kofleriaceae bacterium]|nr:hypothetical protein [Kofleriaceae bacterium]